MENDDLFVPKRDISPIPIRVTDEELAARNAMNNDNVKF